MPDGAKIYKTKTRQISIGYTDSITADTWTKVLENYSVSDANTELASVSIGYRSSYWGSSLVKVDGLAQIRSGQLSVYIKSSSAHYNQTLNLLITLFYK